MKWIDVQVKLPDPMCMVRVLQAGRAKYGMMVRGPGPEWLDSDFRATDVPTHWCPLPPPWPAPAPVLEVTPPPDTTDEGSRGVT